MGILSRLTKAKDAGGLHVAHVGQAAFNVTPWNDPGITTGQLLVKRYGFWVHRCVKLNAEQAAAVPFKLMRVARGQAAKDFIRSGHYKPLSPRQKAYLSGRLRVKPSASIMKAAQGNIEDLVEVESAPLLDVLHEISPWMDGYAFRTALYSDLQIFGRAFTLIVDGKEPVELWRMMPQYTKIIRDPVDFVAGYQVGFGTDAVTYDAEEVLWFKEFDPSDPWGGIGPLEAWLKTVDAAFAIEGFQYWLMSRGGTPDHILTTESPMDEAQKKAFRRTWRAMFGNMGGRRENIGVLTGKEVNLTKLSQTNRELEFTASSDQKRDQIGQAFGVPKSILDVSEIRANNREAKQQHIEYTIWPMVQRVEDVLNARLVPRFAEGMFLMHENPVPDDRELRIQDRESKLRSGWTINEIRADEGEEPSEDTDADVTFIASGVVPLHMAATDTTPETDTEDVLPGSPDMDAGGAAPDSVLQGQQITAASAIIQSVIDEKLPIESARGQLEVMFNLTREQAEQMLEGVAEFEKPDPPVLTPPAGVSPAGGPGDSPGMSSPAPESPPPGESPSLSNDAKGMMAAVNTNTMATVAAMAECVKAFIASQPTPAPPGSIHLHQGEQTITLPTPEAPIVNVEVQPMSLPAPEAPIVNVLNDVQTPTVNVEPPDVRVEVAAPPQLPAPDVDVKVEVAAPEVQVESPMVSVQHEPHISVTPEVEVNLNGSD